MVFSRSVTEWDSYCRSSNKLVPLRIKLVAMAVLMQWNGLTTDFFRLTPITVKVPERVRFWHGNVHLSAYHSSSCKKSWAVTGLELYIFIPKSYTFRSFAGTASKTSRHFYLQTFFLIRAFENALKREIQSPFWSGRVPPWWIGYPK